MALTLEPGSDCQPERRNFPRWELPVGCARLNIRRSGQRRYSLSGAVSDISCSGVGFQLDEALGAGEVVDVKVTLCLDGAELLRATGRVVRFMSARTTGPVRQAIAFTDVHQPSDPEKLTQRLLDILMPQGPRPAA